MRLTITGKALIGFVLMITVLAAVIFVMARVMGRVSDSVGLVSQPNDQLNTWKAVLRENNQAGMDVQAWKISHQQAFIDNFDSCRFEASAHLDQLKKLTKNNPEASALTDSLRNLVEERFYLLGNWIAIADTVQTPDHVENEILEAMSKREREMNKRRSEQSEDAGAEQPTHVDHETPAVASTTSKEESRNFWQRLLHPNKKAPVNALPADTATVSLAPSDTAYLAPPDTAHTSPQNIALEEISRIRRMIEEGKAREMSNTEANLREEMLFLRSDNAIQERLTVHTGHFERIMAIETEEKIRSFSEISAAGTRDMIISMFAFAVLLILVFTFFISQDVKREKRLQAQLQVAKENAEHLSKAKEDFLANMSHEIRTPLNIISGFSSQLVKSELDQNQRIQAEGIRRSAEHLVTLVNDILDFSKMQSGMMELETIGFRVGDLAGDLRSAFGMMRTKKDLYFEVIVTPGVPAILVSDPVRIRQVLYNLCSNAMKFTEKGSVRVIFSFVPPKEEQVSRLIVSVSDTGIGISKEKLDSVFDAFTQADSSITRRYGGTGLGLAITKLIVDEMQGEIKVESEPGKGTTFSISIPIAEGTTADLPAVTKEPENFSMKGKVVMICDDEAFNRLVAGHVLKNYGATIVEAGGGEEALVTLKRQHVDLILMDLQMPGMGGTETVKHIRALPDPEIAAVPVIAVTGLVNPEERQKCENAGMNGYLAKPYKEAQLVKEIRSVLQSLVT